MQYNTIQYNTEYNTIQYNTIQYNTIQYNTIQYNTIQYNIIQYNTMQYNTIEYNTRKKKRLLQSSIRTTKYKKNCKKKKYITYKKQFKIQNISWNNNHKYDCNR